MLKAPACGGLAGAGSSYVRAAMSAGELRLDGQVPRAAQLVDAPHGQTARFAVVWPSPCGGVCLRPRAGGSGGQARPGGLQGGPLLPSVYGR